MKSKIKNERLRRRKRRAYSIRKRVEGTAAKPRLSVFRSARHIYAQLIDDVAGKTLASASTMGKEVKGTLEGKKSDVAEQVGKKLAEAAKAAGIETVVFDRNGYPYHGRVAALAKGARDGGLSF